MLRKNATNGINNEAPLTYKEALEVAKLTVQGRNVDDSLLFTENASNRNNKGGNNGYPNQGNSGGGYSASEGGGNSTGRGANLNSNRNKGNLNPSGGGAGGNGNLNPGGDRKPSMYDGDNFKSKEARTCKSH